MKKLILIVSVFLLCGCGANTYKSISCDEISDDMVLIDVRTEDEFISGHLDDAYNIPLDTMDEKAMSSFNKDIKIVVYCRSGARSKSASEKLRSMGYTNVYDLGAMSNCK